jgi:hypothetical protein
MDRRDVSWYIENVKERFGKSAEAKARSQAVSREVHDSTQRVIA